MSCVKFCTMSCRLTTTSDEAVSRLQLCTICSEVEAKPVRVCFTTTTHSLIAALSRFHRLPALVMLTVACLLHLRLEALSRMPYLNS